MKHTKHAVSKSLCMYQKVDSQARRELAQVYVIFIAFAFILDHLSGIAWVHEAGHALVAVLQGQRVHAFTANMVTIVGEPSDLLLYAGTGLSMLVWGVLSVWLIKSRRSVVGAAYSYGVALSSWVWYWLYYLVDSAHNDVGQMSYLGQFYYAIIHIGAGALLVLVAIKHMKLAAQWYRDNPKHMQNPSAIRKGAVSRA